MCVVGGSGAYIVSKFLRKEELQKHDVRFSVCDYVFFFGLNQEIDGYHGN